MDVDNKFFNVGILIVATLVVAKLISWLIMPRSSKHVPPVVKTWPLIGGLVRFMKGPIVMLREEYPKLGSVFTLNLANKKITFLIGPEVSAHFFKAPESDLSQQEVYQFNVPTFGPGVVFDVDYSVRQEQFRFFTESLRVNKLKGYVDQMVTEAEVSVWLNDYKCGSLMGLLLLCFQLLLVNLYMHNNKLLVFIDTKAQVLVWLRKLLQ